jgi:DNA ligase-1
VSKKFPRLYAKASNGKVKIWEVETKGDTMFIRNGYEDGKIAEQSKKIVGVNKGRSNETTDEQQAELEAESKFQHKLDEQYSQDRTKLVDYADADVVLPMLALKFTERKHNISYPCYVQPKLDGCRMIYQGGKCISRQGKEFTTLDHVAAELKKLAIDVPDGEIYLQGASIQEIIRRLKKERGVRTEELEYWIYDKIDDKDFKERTESIAKAFSKAKFTHLKYVETHLVNSEQEINDWHDKFVQAGYEGVIIRNAAGGYECKHRSSNLQKLKSFEDKEFIIVGGDEAEGADAGTVVFKCKTAAGKEFSVRPRGTREIRANYLKDLKKLIGSELTVRFQGVSEDLIPRFPVGIIVRDYEI